MTIKRKIFLANILAIIIPLIITVFLLGIVAIIYLSATGISDYDSMRRNGAFSESVHAASKLSKDWAKDTDIAKVEKDIYDFNIQYEKDKITLYVYFNGEPLFDSEIEGLLDEISENEKEKLIIDEDSSFYYVKSGSFTLITVSENYTIKNYKFNVQNLSVSAIVITVVIAAVLAVSFILSRFLSKSISKPIDILINGVNQISAGNLSFRIDYKKKDEFNKVCSDFNEMAERLSDSVEQQKKNEANRKELIAGISHDLRSPLTSIKAYLEGIEKGVAATPETYNKYFTTIKNKTNELEKIIEQLFLFSKMDIGEYPFHFETIDIPAELNKLINEIKDEYYGKGLKINLNAANETLYSSVDIQQLRNVFYNIIQNSAKYKDKDMGEISISCSHNEDKILIEFSDDGPGVPEDALDKLFDIFYRYDSSRNNKKSGSGLGLAIAFKAVEKMNGAIKAKNNSEGGLTISITLPLAEVE